MRKSRRTLFCLFLVLLFVYSIFRTQEVTRTERNTQEQLEDPPDLPLFDDNSRDSPTSNSEFCIPGKPCVYPEEVDLRLIILTYNRWESLNTTLGLLDHLLLDGHKSSLEIFIDRSKSGHVHNKTLEVAKAFKWSKGPTRVHVQRQHTGIYGQWVDTWRPQPNSSELAIYIEDDVDMSPFAYRWLQAAHRKYGHFTDISGYCIQDDNVPIVRGKHMVKDVFKVKKDFLRKYPAYFYRVAGSWGYAPHPVTWVKFQDWFHGPAKEISHPYVANAKLNTQWYKVFEKQKRADSMWTMWYIYFTNANKLSALFSNLPLFSGHVKTSLVYNRQEAGLHYENKERNDSSAHLMQEWSDSFIDFPEKTPVMNYDGEFTQYK